MCISTVYQYIIIKDILLSLRCSYTDDIFIFCLRSNFHSQIWAFSEHTLYALSNEYIFIIIISSDYNFAWFIKFKIKSVDAVFYHNLQFVNFIFLFHSENIILQTFDLNKLRRGGCILI